MDKKLFDHAPSVSAAWIASRIRRVAHSRSSIFAEKMGYLRDGTDALLGALSLRITSLGGSIFLSNPVEAIEATERGIAGVRVSGGNRGYDIVASTIPLPYLPALVSGPPSQHLRRIARIRNIGVVCTVLKLDRRLSPYFWINTNDHRIQTPGIIEYTNLRPLGAGRSYRLYPFVRSPRSSAMEHERRRFHRRICAVPFNDKSRF